MNTWTRRFTLGFIGFFLLGVPLALAACDPTTDAPTGPPAWVGSDGHTVDMAKYNATQFPILDANGDIVRNQSGDPVTVTAAELEANAPVLIADPPTDGPDTAPSQDGGSDTSNGIQATKVPARNDPTVRDKASQR